QQESRHEPEFFLADSRRFVFQARNTRNNGMDRVIYIGSLDSPARTRLLDNVSTVTFTQGYLLFQRDRTLFVQRFDATTGRLAGEPAPFLDGLDDGTSGMGAYAVATTGVLAYRGAVRTDSSRMTWFAPDGKSLT